MNGRGNLLSFNSQMIHSVVLQFSDCGKTSEEPQECVENYLDRVIENQKEIMSILSKIKEDMSAK